MVIEVEFAAVGPATAASGVEYSGRVTPFLVLSCVVAGSGGLLFGYDLGISGSSRLLLRQLHSYACYELGSRVSQSGSGLLS